VAAVNQAGGKAQQIELAQVGMPGASHMLMQDKHSLQIGDWLARWMDQNIRP
jgi:hypothetical protein